KEYDDSELRELDELVKSDPAKAIEFLRTANSLGKRFTVMKASLPYLPLEDLPKLAVRIPSGAIFSVVRQNRPDKQILVTHQGLVIHKPDGTYVRHLAFQDKGVDVSLTDYFKGYEKSSWKVLGINLLLLNEAGKP